MKRKIRIELTREILSNFFDQVFSGEVAEFCAYKGLPYGLIYNLVHGRISSISAADYRRIFGEDPPEQEPKRVSGEYFRGMARLWLFLNEKGTEKDLYREFYSGKRSVKKTDYRIFTGATKTVEWRLERMMEKKFLDQGLSPEQIQSWIKALDREGRGGRVPFAAVKPVLERLEENLQIHPTRLLNRWISAYESGELKTLSKDLYEKLLDLDRRAREVAAQPSRLRFEKLREEVYGRKEGFVLFSEIEEELNFLKTWGRKSPKKYLGRSMGKYKRGLVKRVAAWREKKIREDCESLIRVHRAIPVAALPRRYRQREWNRIRETLRAALLSRMLSKDRTLFEKEALRPVYHTIAEYEYGGRGYVNVQEAARTLDMSDKGFGLLMAGHRDIFRRIGRYEGTWYIPDLYLTEISRREHFPLVKAKYEWLARRGLKTARHTSHGTQPALNPNLANAEAAANPRRRHSHCEDNGLAAASQNHD